MTDMPVQQPMMGQQPVSPNQPFQITLEAQQWNGVMGQLVKGPYEIVAPLIQLIAQQLQQQAPGAVATNGSGMPLPPDPPLN